MKLYRKKTTQQMEPWIEGYDMSGVSVSEPDQQNGSPMVGDMIAVNAENAEDKWLVAAEFFNQNYEEVK